MAITRPSTSHNKLKLYTTLLTKDHIYNVVYLQTIVSSYKTYCIWKRYSKLNYLTYCFLQCTQFAQYNKTFKTDQVA